MIICPICKREVYKNKDSSRKQADSWLKAHFKKLHPDCAVGMVIPTNAPIESTEARSEVIAWSAFALTPEWVASVIRRQQDRERNPHLYEPRPPIELPKVNRPPSFADLLREAVLKTGKTRKQLSQDTGVSYSKLCNFLSGGSISLDAAEILAELVKVELPKNKATDS